MQRIERLAPSPICARRWPCQQSLQKRWPQRALVASTLACNPGTRADDVTVRVTVEGGSLVARGGGFRKHSPSHIVALEHQGGLAPTAGRADEIAALLLATVRTVLPHVCGEHWRLQSVRKFGGAEYTLC